MTKAYYEIYSEVQIQEIKACEFCGRKSDLHILPFPGAILIDCDNCGRGKILNDSENLSGQVSKNQIFQLDEIIEEALSENDKEVALYKAKAKIRKISK